VNPAVERFGWRFQARNKVIQTENNYKKDVFNGDFSTIQKIDPIEHEVSIKFDDRLVTQSAVFATKMLPIFQPVGSGSTGGELTRKTLPFDGRFTITLVHGLLHVLGAARQPGGRLMKN
jgi:exodeoxyribonuclease V alpha subunit